MSTVDLGEWTVEQRGYMRDTSGMFVAACEAGAQISAKELAEQLHNLAAVYVPKGKGRTHTPQTVRLISTLSTRAIGAAQYAVTAGPAPHAGAHEKGAVPHDIPNAFGRGITVKHPGNKAQHYLERAGRAVAVLSPAVVRRNMPGG